MIPTRDQALEILDEFVENENLKKHMYCVEACMRAYAKKFEKDIDQWGVTGLLHDADWEKYPDVHPKKILEKLKELDVDAEIIHAIASHGNNSEQYGLDRFEERKSLMDKVLFACDELSGFIIACALVRPNKLDDLKAKSVKKKLKDKSFAAQVNRDEIRQGAEELEVDISEHITFLIETLREIKKDLGLN